KERSTAKRSSIPRCPQLLQRADKRRRALPVAGNFRNARVGRQLRTAIDRLDGEVKLRTVGPAGERDPNRVEQRPALLPRVRTNVLRHGAKALAIEPRGGGE